MYIMCTTQTEQQIRYPIIRISRLVKMTDHKFESSNYQLYPLSESRNQHYCREAANVHVGLDSSVGRAPARQSGGCMFRPDI